MNLNSKVWELNFNINCKSRLNEKKNKYVDWCK